MTCQADSDSLLESLVVHHAAASEFRQRPRFEESRRVLRIGPNDLPYNLTETTLTAPDMIARGPYVFTDDEAGSLLAFYHLGLKLAGHSKLVHGGLAAVLLDECMGRACFPRLAGKVAVTAQLDLSYKSPIPVDSVVVIRADTIKVEGRKAWVEARVEDARKGTVLVQAKGLFIEPKWAVEMAQVV
jgi:acyl-coenzyme A thioesterase PaaI-like protein